MDNAALETHQLTHRYESVADALRLRRTKAKSRR
jgi:hypothetical protein